MMRNTTSASAPRERTQSRRTMIKRGGLLAGLATLFGTTGVVASSYEHEVETMHLDLACDGRTLAINRPAGADPDRGIEPGDTFMLHGTIYPAGTIDQGLTGPDQEGAIGRWVCQGWFHDSLPQIQNGAFPECSTTQLYLLDGSDGLVSEGMQGGSEAIRAVTGGYGHMRYLRGDVRQRVIEVNATDLHVGDGQVLPAPNIRFDFRFCRS